MQKIKGTQTGVISHLLKQSMCPVGWISLCFSLLSMQALAIEPPVGTTSAPAECARVSDDLVRLACYDRHFQSGRAARQEDPKSSLAPATQAMPVLNQQPTVGESSPWTTGEANHLAGFNTLSKFWELSPEDKQGTFVVKTYLPNFYLPVHYTSNINRAPNSPTYPETIRNNYRQTESKFQISLRAKAFEGLLLPNADLWLAFTQRSLWQFWNRQESEPFRSNDFQPEAIYVVPIREGLVTLPGGWKWRMAQLGAAHQSNGQSDPLSRSWNRVYAAAAFERGDFGLSFKVNHRTSEPGEDDNPGLMRYIGNTEVAATWLPGLTTASLVWRMHPANSDSGSLQFDWSYPVVREKPNGLRWYVQLFSGYGETMLDYNHRQTSIGAGLSLFQY
ncbi:MAG: phospholipase A [Proteobacteria bacterium]|nr:phospholipase A [Pseudomonadota bacterium]